MKTTNKTTALNFSRFFDDNVSTEDAVKVCMTLKDLRFFVSDDGNTMKYGEGSICNYRKIEITKIRMATAPDDNKHLTVMYTYEEGTFPGYDCVDHEMTWHGGSFWEEFLEKHFKYALKRLYGE